MRLQDLPRVIDGGKWNTGHVQGIAVDTARGYVYFSFTTVLVKTDLLGNLIGYVGGLVGHLGCIDINPEDGRVYGSLEFKNDSIGRGIYKNLGLDGAPTEDAFYVAIFDVDKITAPAMDAERDGIMRAAYLPDVAADYAAVLPNGTSHRYGCSGVDGTAFGPVFGADNDTPWKLMIAYGIYSDLSRTDNDHQVILQYDPAALCQAAQPLLQQAPHHSGPAAEARYFFFTGNTDWGVQNLAFDPEAKRWLVAVYRGKKPQYPNFSLFLIDANIPPVAAPLAGHGGEVGLVLTAAPEGVLHEESGVRGFDFAHGTTGIHVLGGGHYYVSHCGRTEAPERLHTCHVHLYRAAFDTREGLVLAE